MRRYLPLLASLAIVIGVGLLVFGLSQYHGPTVGGRLPPGGSSSGWPSDAESEIAIGAMLIVAGALGHWHSRTSH